MAVDIGPKPPKNPGGQPNRPSSGSGSQSGGGAADGAGGSGQDPYAAAVEREKNYRHRAAVRYAEQADILSQQAKALRIALGKKGFRAELKQKLQNVRLVTRQQDNLLMQGYRERVGELATQADDNLDAASSQTVANLSNAGRERASAISEAMLQGAGESDVLRAQQMALRNWNANQNEVNRAYSDTQNSINAALTDLNVDTKSARANVQMQANADRELLYNAYYDQRSEALTALGNTFGQMAEYYSMANEQEKADQYRQAADLYSSKSGKAFERAARMSGAAWENPGISKRIKRWDGRDEFDQGLSRQKAPAVDGLERPEGATLRGWSS